MGDGEGGRGFALLAEIQDRLGTAPSSSRSKLLAATSERLAIGNNYEAAARLAQESIAMAEALRIDPPPLALLYRGMSRVALGDLAGESDVRLAAERQLQAGLPHGATVAIFNLGNAMSASGPAAGLAYIEESIELAMRFGMDAEVWSNRAGRLGTLAGLGRFDEVLKESVRPRMGRGAR